MHVNFQLTTPVGILTLAVNFRQRVQPARPRWNTYSPRKNAGHQDSVAGSQYAEIHNRAFHDGHEELAQPGDTMPRDESVLGGGVVDGEKEGNRIEGEEEKYVREFNGHGIWFDETR